MKTLRITLNDTNHAGDAPYLGDCSLALQWEISDDCVTWTPYMEAMVRFLNGLGFSINDEDILHRRLNKPELDLSLAQMIMNETAD